MTRDHRCKLCGSDEPLRDSHILPEFLYRPAYDDSHTAVLFDQDRKTHGKRQKGFSEPLLCERCEGKCGQWETYFSRVWFHPEHRLRPIAIPGKTVVIDGLDYARFKLFHLSVVWRAGVSSRREFRNVTLGAQESKLRDRLLSGDPGEPSDYAFFGIALRDPETGGFQDTMVKVPDAARVHGHWAYAFLFGGALWHYWVSSHTAGRVVPPTFDRNGTLTLAVQDWTENVFVLSLARDIRLPVSGRAAQRAGGKRS